MSISSAIKSASSRWLSWRSECRCGAWHPEIISPCGASPRCSRSRQVSNATCAPMLCPASKSGVSGDTDASSSFASSAASCVMLLSGSRWRRRSRPGQSPEKARNQPVAQLASGETRYCCRQRKGTWPDAQYCRSGRATAGCTLQIASQRLLIIIVVETG